MKPFIKIHPADTVAVALSPLKKGTEIQRDSQTVTLTEDIPQGHKFALTDIAEGEAVIKYGNPIGVAKTDIAKGSWIHTHNMKTGLGDLLTAVSFMKLETPVSFDPGDPELDAQLFFTLASCNPEQHLDNMSRLSEMLMNEDLVEELAQAKTPEDLLKLEEKYITE